MAAAGLKMDIVRSILRSKREEANQSEPHHGRLSAVLLLDDEPDSFVDQHQRGDRLLKVIESVDIVI